MQAPTLRVFQAETRLTVYCLFQYGTSTELVPNEMGQRPAVVLANGDEDLMDFKERSALIVSNTATTIV